MVPWPPWHTECLGSPRGVEERPATNRILRGVDMGLYFFSGGVKV